VTGASLQIPAGPTGWVVIHSGPGQRAGVANDIAVNEVAQASKGVRNGGEERASIKDD